jgi:hypothetical protein
MVSWTPAYFLFLHADYSPMLYGDEDDVWEEVAEAHCKGILLRE